MSRIKQLGLPCALVLVLMGCARNSQLPPEAPAPVVETPRVSGPVGVSGVLDDAPWRIDIPQDWNGDLVMLLHGYEPVGVPRESEHPANPAAGVFLARGYAVAASAYASQGWAVAEALVDNERLREHFIQTYGQPRRTFVSGFSMGGHLSLAIIEREAKHYDGALSFCGANAPAAEMFDDGIMTTLVALDYFFPAALALPAGGLVDPQAPPGVDPAQIEAALATNETLARQLATRLQIPRDGLAGTSALFYLVLREMQQRAGGQPVDNRNTRYQGFGDDAAFNRGVRRYAGDPQAIDYTARNASLSGQPRDPVVILSNAIDPTIQPRFDTRYAELAKQAGAADWVTVMPTVGEGHCNFSFEQMDAGLVALEQAARR